MPSQRPLRDAHTHTQATVYCKATPSSFVDWRIRNVPWWYNVAVNGTMTALRTRLSQPARECEDDEQSEYYFLDYSEKVAS